MSLYTELNSKQLEELAEAYQTNGFADLRKRWQAAIVKAEATRSVPYSMLPTALEQVNNPMFIESHEKGLRVFLPFKYKVTHCGGYEILNQKIERDVYIGFQLDAGGSYVVGAELYEVVDGKWQIFEHYHYYFERTCWGTTPLFRPITNLRELYALRELAQNALHDISYGVGLSYGDDVLPNKDKFKLGKKRSYNARYINYGATQKEHKAKEVKVGIRATG